MPRFARRSDTPIWLRRVSVGVVSGLMVAGCGVEPQETATILEGLHACSSTGQVVGALIRQSETETEEDGPGVYAYDTWLLNLDGSAKQATQDGIHLDAIISPDARSLIQLRSSGRILGDAVERPNVIEKLDIETGRVSEIATLSQIGDLSMSYDGKLLAVAHAIADEGEPDGFLHGVTLVDLDSGAVGGAVPKASDVPSGVFSAVEEIALSPDGRFLAYALAVEAELYRVVYTLRLRDLETNRDSILYTAEDTDFISDLAWSADGMTVIAAVRYINDDDTIESPARFRALRVNPEDRQVSTADGFTQRISPISRDGNRLLGITHAQPDEEGLHSYDFVAWDDESRMTEEVPFDGGAQSVSIASCSYS